jgi:hypothetical protein
MRMLEIVEVIATRGVGVSGCDDLPLSLGDGYVGCVL